jgi:hypothetical protein
LWLCRQLTENGFEEVREDLTHMLLTGEFHLESDVGWAPVAAVFPALPMV